MKEKWENQILRNAVNLGATNKNNRRTEIKDETRKENQGLDTETLIVSQTKWLTCRCLSGKLRKKTAESESLGQENKAHIKRHISQLPSSHENHILHLVILSHRHTNTLIQSHLCLQTDL